MRKLTLCSLLAIALALSACGKAGRKWDPAPSVFVRLAQADLICANKAGWAQVDVFITLRNLPPQGVKVSLSGAIMILSGSELHGVFEKAGIGRHTLEVLVPDFRQEPYTKVFTIVPRELCIIR